MFLVIKQTEKRNLNFFRNNDFNWYTSTCYAATAALKSFLMTLYHSRAWGIGGRGKGGVGSAWPLRGWNDCLCCSPGKKDNPGNLNALKLKVLLIFHSLCTRTRTWAPALRRYVQHPNKLSPIACIAANQRSSLSNVLSFWQMWGWEIKGYLENLISVAAVLLVYFIF